MEQPQYQGILFPDRAEHLGEKAFEGYRVFLDFWDPLAAQLRASYEGLAMRRDSRALLIYGPQGSGKTLFAKKLSDDFLLTQTDVVANKPVIPTASNLWHRITGGTIVGNVEGKLDSELIKDATIQTALLAVESDKKWVDTAVDWMRNQRNRRCMIVMDNAERNYFIQGLVALDDAAYLQLADNPKTASLAAERFVALCRNELRGCLFVMFTNNDLFALSLDEHVNGQHKGLITLTNLPLPGSQEKETVVRVNTNRLNRISYWFCLDKAGPDEKMSVYTALRGASTFPDSFSAVDRAIKHASPTRMGRPARKCMLTLIVLSDITAIASEELFTLGDVEREEFNHSWLGLWLYKSNWAPLDIPSDAALLESEWQLRIAVVGSPFSNALMSGDDAHLSKCSDLLRILERVHGPGTREGTRESTSTEMRTLVDSWPSISPVDPHFWTQGQTRSVDYEDALRRIYSNYNVSGEGFLSYRPDLVLAPYTPCSILSAQTGNIEHINAAIKREAHVFEFTAIKTFSVPAVSGYLKQKLQNYVEVIRQQ